MPDAKGWRPFRLEVRGTLKSLSVLHIGSGEALHVALDAPLLRDTGGNPYIPGASIRGIWKHWLHDERALLGCSEETYKALFGSAPKGTAGDPNNANETYLGRLTVEEAWLEEPSLNAVTTGSEVRDHVRIDRETGSAADQAKFDGEVLPAGACFSFRMAYEGDGPADAPLVLLREALRLIQSGAMRVGAKSGWGYGMVQLEQVRHRIFQRTTDSGLAAWLQARYSQLAWQPGPPDLSLAQPDGTNEPSVPVSSLSFRLRLHFEGPVLVRSSLPPRPDEADAVFIVTGPGDGYYLPGSSLRGVLRSRACWIAGRANATLVNLLFGPELHDAASEADARRGLLEISDGVRVETAWAPEVLVDHVAIDRIVGGARDGAKFNTKPLVSPAFDVSIRVRFRGPTEARALALWGRLLRDLLRNPGDLWVGASTSRGYGYLRYSEVLSADLDLARAPATILAALPQTPEQRPGRAIYHLQGPGFADFAPLWKLAGDAWSIGEATP